MEHERQMLSRCATGDDGFTAELIDRKVRFAALEPKEEALVRISALVALHAPEVLCCNAVRRAFDVGASAEDVVATLINVSMIVGSARVVSAAPAIAHGLGYEIDAAL